MGTRTNPGSQTDRGDDKSRPWDLAIYRFGVAACLLVIPYALIFGSLRGIPFFWRILDCGFGVGGFPLMLYCHGRARALEKRE